MAAVKKVPFRIFVDSGAPTLYNQLARQDKEARHMGSFLKDRKRDDYSFLESEKYLDYKQEYIRFIKDNEHLIEVYPNLDVINNPEATWRNQQELEAAGLNPMPVFHFGSDIKWLKRYLRRGHDYIAIGGMVPNPASVLIPALDKMWDKYLTDDKGMPVVKVHGFAATSIRLMTRYPWYSVDSASWIKYALYGIIIFPALVLGKPCYRVSPLKLPISTRSTAIKERDKHLFTLSERKRKAFIEKIEAKGYALGRSSFRTEDLDYEIAENEVEVSLNESVVGFFDESHAWRNLNEISRGKKVIETVEEKGVTNDHNERHPFNAEYYIELQRSLPEWPWAFKPRRGLFS